jgi:hypothetical protein
VAVVIMNERMDIDDDQDIAEGRPLPLPALSAFLSACRGIISRLFFLHTPSVAPSPASVLVADMAQWHTAIGK